MVLTLLYGAIDPEMGTIPTTAPLGDGTPSASNALVIGGKELTFKITLGWKNALVGTNVTGQLTMEDPKVAHGTNGQVISLLDTLVDTVTSSLKLCVVGRFVAFRPTIEMVRKWVGQKWRVKGSVGISTMPSDLF